MATLEKIRSKSVFLIVVIGLALLAFIVGDALTNSRNIFGDQTTVAKVGSTKIDYTEYQRKREELNNQYEEARRRNPQQFANFDTQQLGEMALEQLIQQTVIDNAAKKAGVKSSANLLRYYMLENMGNPKVQELMQSLQQSGLAAQTPAQAYDIIFNPKRNGLTEAQVEPMQRAWLAAEKETDQQIAEQIYQRLLAGTVKANDLDMKALYDDYVNTKSVDYAFLPFGNLNEKEYPVTDAELKAKYDEIKGRFAVDEATKEIGFISVTVTPSDKDIAAAKALADQTVAFMNKNAGPLSKELKKDGVSMSRHTVLAADIPGNVRNAVTAGGDSARLAYNNSLGFGVVRVLSTKQEVDSVQITLVQAATEDCGRRVLSALNAGLPADSIGTKFSPDSVMAQPDQWIALYDADGATNAIPAEQLDTLRQAAGRYVSIVSGPQGMVIAKLVKQNAPKTVYEYDEASYVLGPSNATLNDERGKLEKFLAQNNDAKKFMANASKAGFNVQNFTVTASLPAVPRFAGMNSYYPDSRQVMRWVMIDGESDAVSHIYESKNPTAPLLYAAAVISEYDDYAPLSNKDIKDYVTDLVRSEKAGKKLVDKFSKNTQSLQSAAQAMGVQVQSNAQFRFGRNMGVGDPEVTGKIYGTPANKKVVITAGQDGVYVYQVMGQNTEKFPFNEQQYQQQYYQLLNPNMFELIKGDRKVKNNIYRFEAGD